MQALQNKLNKILTGINFELSTGSQSFNVYPTEHIEVVFHDLMLSVEVGTRIYGNVKTYQYVVNNLRAIVESCNDLSDYVCVNVANCHKTPYNVSFGGCDYELETFHFATIEEMITKIKSYEFIEISYD